MGLIEDLEERVRRLENYLREEIKVNGCRFAEDHNCMWHCEYCDQKKPCTLLNPDSKYSICTECGKRFK